ncbi:unnamed protein product, partial [Nesidiocoris tenuis]
MYFGTRRSLPRRLERTGSSVLRAMKVEAAVKDQGVRLVSEVGELLVIQTTRPVRWAFIRPWAAFNWPNSVLSLVGYLGNRSTVPEEIPIFGGRWLLPSGDFKFKSTFAGSGIAAPTLARIVRDHKRRASQVQRNATRDLALQRRSRFSFFFLLHISAGTSGTAKQLSKRNKLSFRSRARESSALGNDLCLEVHLPAYFFQNLGSERRRKEMGKTAICHSPGRHSPACSGWRRSSIHCKGYHSVYRLSNVICNWSLCEQVLTSQLQRRRSQYFHLLCKYGSKNAAQHKSHQSRGSFNFYQYLWETADGGRRMGDGGRWSGTADGGRGRRTVVGGQRTAVGNGGRRPGEGRIFYSRFGFYTLPNVNHERFRLLLKRSRTRTECDLIPKLLVRLINLTRWRFLYLDLSISIETVHSAARSRLQHTRIARDKRERNFVIDLNCLVANPLVDQ